MNFTTVELEKGINRLCNAAKLNVREYSRQIARALIDFPTPPHVENAFAVVMADPFANKTSPDNLHSMLKFFMHKFMGDYGLMSMDRKMISGMKWRQALTATLLGEVNVQLIENSGETITGKPGTTANERFKSKYFGLRHRLFMHEDILLPTKRPKIRGVKTRRGLSEKYIANFDYCDNNVPDEEAGFYDSVESLVTVAGMYFNMIEFDLKFEPHYIPESLDDFIDALEDAVQSCEGEMTPGALRAMPRLHGLLTKSAPLLFETLGLKVVDEYRDILDMHYELREYLGEIGPKEAPIGYDS